MQHSRLAALAATFALFTPGAAFALDGTITWTTYQSSYVYADGDTLLDLTDELADNYIYCSKAVDEASGLSGRGTCGSPGTELGFRLSLSFPVCDPGDYRFEMGPDFGRGGALFIDGALVDASTDDLWWAGNWAATSELLIGDATLELGWHTVDAIGFEGCCDGAQAMRFSVDGGTFDYASAEGLGCDASSVEGLCPCDGDWANHGKYVSCVAHAAKAFADAGLISTTDKGSLVEAAALSTCGT